MAPKPQMYPIEGDDARFNNVAKVDIDLHPNPYSNLWREQFLTIKLTDIYGVERVIHIHSRFGGKHGGRLHITSNLLPHQTLQASSSGSK